MGIEMLLIIAGLILLLATSLHGLGIAFLSFGIVLLVVELLFFGAFIRSIWKRF